MKASMPVVLAGLLLAGCATAVPLVANSPASVTALEGTWKGAISFYEGGVVASIEFLGLKVSGDTVDGQVVRHSPRFGTITERPRMKLEKGELRGEGGVPAFEFTLKMYDLGGGHLELRGPFSMFFEGRERGGEIRARKQR